MVSRAMGEIAAVVIDTSDLAVRQVIVAVTAAWGIGVLVVLYSLWVDISDALRSRKPKRAAIERRFIEPCGDGLHTYEDDGLDCTTCKQPKEPLT